jgi:RNA-directed DNA polymerase
LGGSPPEIGNAAATRKPETFAFLGFTHICATDRHGRFQLKRVTSKNARVLQGHYNYHAVPDNSEALHGFRRRVIRLWLQALRRRSQKDCLTWKRMFDLKARWLPEPRILHPWPGVRFDARTQGRSPVRV